MDDLVGDPQPDSSCDWHVLTFNAANDIVMSLLGIGTFVSFVPMWFAIGLAGSSRGVSVTAMLLLNVTNYMSTLGVTLQNWQRLLCCPQWNAEHCARSLIPVVLVAANVLGCLPILALCVVYFEPDPELAGRDSAASGERRSVVSRGSRASTAVSKSTFAAPQQVANSGGLSMQVTTKGGAAACFVAQLLLMAVTCGIAALLLHKYGVKGDPVSTYADASNILAGVTQALSWVPQIGHTYRTRDIGNLSVVTVLLQAPGAAIVAVSLISDGQELTSVVQYVVTFICMTVLLFECLYFVAIQRPKGAPLCGYVCRHAILRECRSADAEEDEEDGLLSDGSPRKS
eukprot:TRINITY_DN8182_c0_g1_i1.p1 TRINITY_DN8182_c0_g1~~TRINITY_DN8182_c0_g1_i1.p1  ORF type:complete len:376 (+),score=142.26 TRINITY_DN8182_c0_g1_i1:101-1129(+)